MIVTEEQVSAALEYLADTNGAAEARFNLTVAENAANEIWSRLFLEAEGAVARREATATSHPLYQAAQHKVACAQRSHEKHRARANSAEMVIEVWRTENANARAAERVR